MKETIKDITSVFSKFDGDKEKECYLILSFFQKNNIDINSDDDPHQMMYLYLCSLVDIILQNSSPESEILSDVESDFVESIEEMFELLES